MLRKRLRVAVGVAVIAALTAAAPVLGTAVGSGGPLRGSRRTAEVQPRQR